MLIETLQLLFTRDLNRLRAEIVLYKNEENIWKREGSIANSAGNLCLHLVGNLNTYIGKEIGKTGYVRNRDLEFSLKNVPRAELLHKIDDTIRVVNAALHNLDESDLANEYPVLVFEEKTSTGYLLMHLATHLTYHLGQVNYHRRLIEQ
ncbi:DinB family protein [Flavisolibacter nicotianae]|uniref:DinB family protein n=1 Tax=Flavisolibacter nicotianae TaxID=2364882 RepID=UPI000EB05703|nr:DinB family protein [Flavisolibacter nicotianae]